MTEVLAPAVSSIIVVLTCALTIVRYETLPDRVPLGLHFNSDDAGNGPRYMIWFFPFVQLGLTLQSCVEAPRTAIFLCAIVAVLYFAQLLTIDLSLRGPSRGSYLRFWASFAFLVAAGSGAAFALPLR
jgi:hypothetical protein